MDATISELLERILPSTKIVGTVGVLNQLNAADREKIVAWAFGEIDSLGSILREENEGMSDFDISKATPSEVEKYIQGLEKYTRPLPHIKSEYAALAVKIGVIVATLSNDKERVEACVACFEMFRLGDGGNESVEKVIADTRRQMARKAFETRENKEERPNELNVSFGCVWCGVAITLCLLAISWLRTGNWHNTIVILAFIGFPLIAFSLYCAFERAKRK